MICPNCKREMRAGYIYSWSQPAQWAPDSVKPSFMMAKPMRGGVFLREKRPFGLVRRHQAEAHYCSACDIVVAPTK